MKNSYKYVISLGCMCSNALSLRQIGLRESSGFFDWLNSSLSASMKIIENNFTDILNIDFLSQDFAEQPRIVTNTFYGFSFVHLFNPNKTFDAQKKKAELYIKKQIENSRCALESGECLCIYYCRDINEQKQIEESFISDIYPFFSERKIDILFIFNYKPPVVIENFDYYVIEQNNIHRPFGGE